MMARTLAALLLVVGALAFAAACGGDDDAPPTRDTSGGAKSTTTQPAAKGNIVDEITKVDYPAELLDGMSLGKADAPVTIQMFEDFTCSHCLEFTATLEPGIIEELVKPGKARLEFHYFPLRQSSVPAMVAAQCAAEQDQFWAYGKRLFTEQAKADVLPKDQVGPALTAAFSQASLKQYATDLGMDGAAFDTCYTGDAALQKVLDDGRKGDALGVQGTPTFVINGTPLLNGYPSTVAEWTKLVENTK